MRIVGKILKGLLLLVVLVAAGIAGWLYFAPPALIRVGTAYSAKIVCSNHFLAGRDADAVLALDVQAPGHPLLKYIHVDVDEEARSVSAKLLGLFGEGRAVHREGAGCATVPAGTQLGALPAVEAAGQANAEALWPIGERVAASQDPALAALLDDAALTGPGMRAVVVAHNGRIVGERYGEGFGPETPLLGWSMTKTVTTAIIATLVGEGRLSLDQDGLFEEWDVDERGTITIADLLSMSSGLEFNEDYGDVTDVTRMLYLQPDMAAFAADKPLTSPIGETFSYSSGTTLLLSRIWQNAFDDPAEALAFPRKAIFGPIGMTSAVLEADSSGTFVGSSYLYATARDWARFGLFLLDDGRWQARQILPEGFVSWMREEAPASNGEYGRGHLWLKGSNGGGEASTPALPGDTFWLRGHDGQTVAVVPSRGLVVVRLGLTPSKLGHRPEPLVAALAALLPAGND
jgi:CubicO group peptidase (beta-lactamase class C family)